MMLVPYKIRPSTVHGIGVFAAAKIRKGILVWSYSAMVDERISGDKADSAFVRYYGFKQLGKDFFILCGDGAIFVNHSDSPTIGSRNPLKSFALRDINEGEELLEDYRIFDDRPLHFKP